MVYVINREWALSEQNLAKAYALNPNAYLVLNGASWLAAHIGNCDRAVNLMERSLELNPNDLANQGNFSDLLVQCQFWELAKVQSTIYAAAMPGSFAEGLLAQVNAYLGNDDEALVHAQRAEGAGSNLATIAKVYRDIGHPDEANRLLKLSGRLAESMELNPGFYFNIHLATGNPNKAIEGLRYSIDTGFPWQVARDLHYFSEHPYYDLIRSHPEFEVLVNASASPVELSERLSD